MAVGLGMPFAINALWPDQGMNSLIHLSRGWARQEGVNYFIYWLRNVGPWLVAVISALVIFYRKKDWNRFVPLALAVGLFAVFAHLILAPWDWDNIKLLVWCYVLALFFIQDWLWNDRSENVKMVVFVFFCLPGFLIFMHSLPYFSRGTGWASERELNKATALMKDQDVNRGLLIAPEYDHPALLLGFKLYMGYPGHVWSHGYNYGPREANMNRYFSGDEAVLSALIKDQVKMTYQGPLEKRREKPEFSGKGLFKVGEALDHELYRLEQK
jgi:hypothetical protein